MVLVCHNSDAYIHLNVYCSGSAGLSGSVSSSLCGYGAVSLMEVSRGLVGEWMYAFANRLFQGAWLTLQNTPSRKYGFGDGNLPV